MTTINLRKGLEAEYYLDSRYYDSGAGEMSDLSGNGRHATASGGPTVGVEGPDDFEATSFDGSDDYFSLSSPIEIDDTQTLFAKVKPANTNVVISNGNPSSGEGLFLLRTIAGPQFEMLVRDANGDSVTAKLPFDYGEWYTVVALYDGSQISLRVGQSVKNMPIDSIKTPTTDNFTIASYPGGNNYLDGDIAHAGYWSRDLSDAEIQQLNRLTAPRRAML